MGQGQCSLMLAFLESSLCSVLKTAWCKMLSLIIFKIIAIKTVSDGPLFRPLPVFGSGIQSSLKECLKV